MTLALDNLVERSRPLLEAKRDLILVEGAGGWRVPLNETEDLSDLAVRLELPVILVVGLRLGGINHARLSAEAIRADGLRLAGWVGSLVDPAFASDTALYHDNLATLDATLPAPCLGVVPRLPAGDPRAMAAAAADHLALPDGRTIEASPSERRRGLVVEGVRGPGMAEVAPREGFTAPPRRPVAGTASSESASCDKHVPDGN